MQETSPHNKFKEFMLNPLDPISLTIYIGIIILMIIWLIMGVK